MTKNKINPKNPACPARPASPVECEAYSSVVKFLSSGIELCSPTEGMIPPGLRRRRAKRIYLGLILPALLNLFSIYSTGVKKQKSVSIRVSPLAL